MVFRGLLTALATPFRDGVIDEAAFRAQVRRQIEAGVDGLVPCGTTGEAPTLSAFEQRTLIRWTLEEAQGRPVLAGIGSNSTALAIENARAAAALGVRGVLATAPYYNKPTQEGLFRHFEAIARAIPDVEVCVYDVPGRSVVRVAPSTLERLCAVPNITTVKDATGDLAHLAEVLRRTGDRLTMLSGDDFTVLPFLATGGHGAVSVASNVDPRRMKRLVDATLAGDLDEARALNLALFPLFGALFSASNPIPLKAALHALGLAHDELRLPLCPLDGEKRPALLETLRRLELLPAPSVA